MKIEICNSCGECDNCAASLGARECRDTAVEIIEELHFNFEEMIKSMATSGKDKAELKKFILASEEMTDVLERMELIS